MHRRFLGMIVLAVGLVGCNSAPPPMKDEVDFKGRVTFAGGNLGDVNLVLQPTEAGYLKNLKVAPDGTFSGKAVPGKYMFYFSALESRDRSEQGKFNMAFNKVPEGNRSPDIKNVVNVSSGDIVVEVK